MTRARGFRVDNLELSLDRLDGVNSTASLHSATIAITPEVWQLIAQSAIETYGPDLPFELHYEDSALLDGGLRLTARAKKSFLSASVTADVSLAATPEGLLRATLTDVRAAGGLPVNMLVDQALARVADSPGFTRVGNRAFDIDLARLLARYRAPLTWNTGVQDVRATPEVLTIVCG